MNAALGLKVHSGWAAAVALGAEHGDLHVLDRTRLELVDAHSADWARQPYHAAEELEIDAARALVRRAIDTARATAVRELRALVQRIAAAGHRAVACAVLVGEGMPDWSVEQILAVHFRMHKAEGELFRDVLVRAAPACDLRLVAVPEKRLQAHAEQALRRPVARAYERLAALGKSAGPPWGKDQKQAALAALIALQAP